jgi:NAD(P)-dependent dehydrogenase (short-subunit alcohol dehydrogenase family)
MARNLTSCSMLQVLWISLPGTGNIIAEMWNRNIAVNLAVPVRFGREALQVMTKQKDGVIVNVCSEAALRRG